MSDRRIQNVPVWSSKNSSSQRMKLLERLPRLGLHLERTQQTQLAAVAAVSGILHGQLVSIRVPLPAKSLLRQSLVLCSEKHVHSIVEGRAEAARYTADDGAKERTYVKLIPLVQLFHSLPQSDPLLHGVDVRQLPWHSTVSTRQTHGAARGADGARSTAPRIGALMLP